MRQHPVDFVAGCHRPGSGLRDDARQQFSRPLVTNASFHRRNLAPLPRQPLPGLGKIPHQLLRIAMGEMSFEIPPHVQQQPLEQEVRTLRVTAFAQVRPQLLAFGDEFRGEDSRSLCRPLLGRFQNRLPDFVDPLPAMRLRRQHRMAELLRQRGEIDFHSAAFCHVDHVQDQHQRQAHVQDLADDVQVPFDVRRIDDTHDDVGSRDIWQASQQDVHRHHFVQCSRGDAVGAGKIDELHRSLADLHPADFLFDRDSGIIPGHRLISGERTEERTFPGVGISDQSDSQRLGRGGRSCGQRGDGGNAHSGLICTRRASVFRSDRR